MPIHERVNSEFEAGGKPVSFGIDDKGRRYVSGEWGVRSSPCACIDGSMLPSFWAGSALWRRGFLRP